MDKENIRAALSIYAAYGLTYTFGPLKIGEATTVVSHRVLNARPTGTDSRVDVTPPPASAKWVKSHPQKASASHSKNYQCINVSKLKRSPNDVDDH